MYPIFRLFKEMILHPRSGVAPLMDTHVSHHRCWPHDIDVYMEMNHGRILTILDLGRTSMAHRVGLLSTIRRNNWGLTMAGVSVRYRKRIKAFDKFRTVSRVVGWDDRFVYIEQSIWIGETCAVQALYRSAVTEKAGIVAPTRLLDALGEDTTSPGMPGWVQSWIDAEATRPWPPTATAPAQI